MRRRQAPLLITNVPDDCGSDRLALWKAPPQQHHRAAGLFEDQVKAVIELSSLSSFTDLQIAFLEQLTANIGIVLNSIEATMQTEGLLKQSQQLASELADAAEGIAADQRAAGQKAQQLAEQNVEVERKNQEIEQARRAVEEKAAELALTSKYKSEFLANMSHELRTPLNSILILGQQLTDNPDRNLTPKQVEFARTIHGAGTDLLNLISDILDLSKIESARSRSRPKNRASRSSSMRWRGRSVTKPIAGNLIFKVEVDPSLGRTIVTDSKRLQQVLKNLLSNAFKFTDQGDVRFRVSRARTAGAATPGSVQAPIGRRVRGDRYRHRHPLGKAEDHLRGLPAGRRGDSRNTAARASASRSAGSWPSSWAAKFDLVSTPGRGSSFTLYLPARYVGPANAIGGTAMKQQQCPVGGAGIQYRKPARTNDQSRARRSHGHPPYRYGAAYR